MNVGNPNQPNGQNRPRQIQMPPLLRGWIQPPVFRLAPVPRQMVAHIHPVAGNNQGQAQVVGEHGFN